MDKELLDLISNEIKIKVLNKQIDEIRYRYVNCKNKNYDCFNVMEFLALYKIDKLEKLKKISSKTADNLRELLTLRQMTKELIAKEMVKTLNYQEDKKLLDRLCQYVLVVDEEFQKYHLFSIIDDLDFVMDCLIKNENYDIANNDIQKEIIKDLRNYYK